MRWPLLTSLALVVSLGYFLFGSQHLSRHIDEKGDSNTYAWNVTIALQGKGYTQLVKDHAAFNPHHLLFDWLGKELVGAVYPRVSKKEYRRKTMELLRYRNLLVGSLTLGLLLIGFYALTRKVALSLGITLLIGFSKGFWIYSQMNDTPLVPTCMAILLFLGCAHFLEGRRALVGAVIVAILHWLTVMFHQSNMILGVPVLAAIAAAVYQKRDLFQVGSRFVGRTALYLLSFVLLVGLSYIYVGAGRLNKKLTLPVAEGRVQRNSILAWMLWYSRVPSRTDRRQTAWGNGFKLPPAERFATAFTGASEAFVHPTGAHPVSDLRKGEPLVQGLFTRRYAKFRRSRGEKPYFHSEKTVASGYLGDDRLLNFCLLAMVGLLLCTALVTLCRRWLPTSARPPTNRVAMVYLLTWVVTSVMFATFWEPDYYEFWLGPIAAIILLAGLLLHQFEEQLSEIFSLSRPTRAMMIILRTFVLFVTVAALSLQNWTTFMQFYAVNPELLF